MKLLECYCVICKRFIGKFYRGLIRKTCSKKCYVQLVALNNSGKNNPNYKHGKYVENRCTRCNAIIDARSIRCHRCNSIVNPNFKGKKHNKYSLLIIGKKSKAKFTEEYIKNLQKKYKGNKKRAINGYILIKDYTHPNRNSHNDILEHIKVMSEHVGRPILKNEIIHHINMVRMDNRIENLFLSNKKQHRKVHTSLNNLVKSLLDNKIIKFENGRYELTDLFSQSTGGEPK